MNDDDNNGDDDGIDDDDGNDGDEVDDGDDDGDDDYKEVVEMKEMEELKKDALVFYCHSSNLPHISLFMALIDFFASSLTSSKPRCR